MTCNSKSVIVTDCDYKQRRGGNRCRKNVGVFVLFKIEQETNLPKKSETSVKETVHEDD